MDRNVGEQNGKPRDPAIWFCAFAFSLIVYVAAYGVMRWQDVLVFQSMKGRMCADGKMRWGDGVTASWCPDDTGPLQHFLGRPAEIVFWPMCELEDAVQRKIHYGYFFRRT